MAIPSLQPALSAAALAAGGIGIAALAFVSAGGYGALLTQRLWPNPSTALEGAVFSAALGYGMLSLLMVLGGVVGVWTRAGAWALLILGLLLSRPFLKLLRRFRLDQAFWTGPPAVLIFLGALWAFLLALAPVTYYDSLVYHFAMPAAYVQAHHWLSLKTLIYPAFPQNLEMLWTFGLLLANDTVANLISLTLAVLAVAATASFARRYLMPSAGPMAALLLAAMPAFLLLSSGGYVDVGLTCYAFLSFYALCVGMDTGRPLLFMLSGALAGLTLGIKYTGAIPAAVNGLLLLFSKDHCHSGFRRRNALLLYSATALLVFSPWLIKNTLYVGNPVFPFFFRWGNPKLSPWVQNAAAGYFLQGLAEYHPRSLIGLLRLPWDIAVKSLPFGGGMDVLGDYGWAPFVAIIPFLIKGRGHSWITRRLGAYAVLSVLPWALTRPVLRFLLPVSPVLALLAAIAWTEGVQSCAPAVQSLCRVGLGALLVFGYVVFFNITGVIGQFPVALGLQDRDDYLSRKLNYYPAARFINHLPQATGVFVLGDQRGYYYNKPVSVSPIFNLNPFVQWANASSSPQDLANRLGQEGITHVIVNRAEMKRLEPYKAFEFSPKGRSTWDAWRANWTKTIYQDNACEVLELRTGVEP